MSASTSQAPSSAPPSESRWSRWGKAGVVQGIKISDWASTYANNVSAKVGGERFWPSSNDMPLELEKCERILRAFTVEGIPQKEEKEEEVRDGKGGWVRKKRKVLKKIPPAAIKRAKGICIYSSMRSGIAPFGGAGGSGIVMARLPNGQWSAPSAVSPQNLAAGLLLGIDFFDVVLLINTEKAVDSFKTHKFTIGAETAIAAGPVGAGTSAEAGLERAPIFSYVRSRGIYAGVEMTGQVFVDRFDENERFYYWPGIKAGDILTGKVRMPPLAAPLHRALRDAEMGIAQGGQLEKIVYDIVQIPESEVMKRLAPNSHVSKRKVAPASAPAALGTHADGNTSGSASGSNATHETTQDIELLLDEDEDDFVREGERLKLPPTPQELEMLEVAGIPDEEDVKWQQQEREAAYKTLPPPMHPHIVAHWKRHPTLGAKRRTTQLEMGGPFSLSQRQAQYVPLPPSPPLKAADDDAAVPFNDRKEAVEEQEDLNFLGSEYIEKQKEVNDAPGDATPPVPLYEALPSNGATALAALHGEKEREAEHSTSEDSSKPFGKVQSIEQKEAEQETVQAHNLNEEEAHKMLRDLALPDTIKSDSFGDAAAPSANASAGVTEEATASSGLTLAPAAHIDERISSSVPAAVGKAEDAAAEDPADLEVEDPAPAYQDQKPSVDAVASPLVTDAIAEPARAAEAPAPIVAPMSIEEALPEPLTAVSEPTATSPLVTNVAASGSSATLASHGRTHSISEASSTGGDNFDSAEQSPNPEYADLANPSQLMELPNFNGLDSLDPTNVAAPALQEHKEDGSGEEASSRLPALLEPVSLLEPADTRGSDSTSTEPRTPTALTHSISPSALSPGLPDEATPTSPISRTASPVDSLRAAFAPGAATPLATPPTRPPKNRPPRSAARGKVTGGTASESVTPVAASPATPAGGITTPDGTPAVGATGKAKRKGRKPPPTE